MNEQHATFEAWLLDALGETDEPGYLADVAEHGADQGYPGLTYTAGMCDVYDQYESEIYDALREDAEGMGYDNVAALVATFGRSDMLDDPDNRKALLVWYMAERIAHTLTEG